jgi:hypothetical protein
MTILYQTLALQYLSTNPTPTTLNISSGDTIELGIDTSSYADGNGWLRYGTPVGCTTSATSGADGQAVVITPNVGATSYSVTFRTLISETSTYYYGRIAGTISSGAPDTTPDAFTFTDQTGVALNSTIISNTITVSGINAASAISISGGTYSINGGAYTSSSGTVTNGQTVSVAHTSSGSNGTAVNTTLTIGGVSDTFTSTTAAAATYTLTFYDSSFASARTNFNEGEGVYAFLSTTAPDGTTLYWSTSSGSDISPVNGSVSVSYGFASVFFTIAADSLTEGTETLTFYIRSGSVSGTVLTSSSITINDTSTAPVTPTYSVANASTNEGASATANVTTTNVANGTTLYWTVNATTADVSTTSGSFTINANAGSFTIPAIADSLTEGTEFYTISVRTGSTAGTIVASSTLTINDTSTTVSDTTPDQFTFTDQTNVSLNTVITSNSITVSGINAAASISVSGGTYSINGGAYTSASGTVTNGQTVSVRHTSSASNSTATNTTLTIGGVSDVFTSTTVAAAPDTTPDAFIFADQNDVALSSTVTSSAITVSGVNTATSISISNGTYSIDGGAYTSASGTVTNGQTVSVRHTSSASNSTATNTTLTIGGVSDVFTSTTVGVATSGLYGLQIFDSSGNITLDTTDNTFKDFGSFTISSVTTNGTITGVPVTSNTIALVNNNIVESGQTTIAPAAVTLAPASSSIVVSGGDPGFNISIRLMEF